MRLAPALLLGLAFLASQTPEVDPDAAFAARAQALDAEAQRIAAALRDPAGRADARRRRESLMRGVEELSELGEAQVRRAIGEAIRTQETLRRVLDPAQDDGPRPEEEIVARAQDLARWFRERETVSAESELRRRWQLARAKADERAREAEAACDAAIAESLEQQSRAASVSRKVSESFARAIASLRGRVPELAGDLDAALNRAAQRTEHTEERGRRAQVKTLEQLRAALESRIAARVRAEEKLAEALRAFDDARTRGTAEWERNLSRVVAEAATSMRDLARTKQAELTIRIEALKTVWRDSDPAARARALEADARSRMCAEREKERDELRSTGRELDSVRARAAALERILASAEARRGEEPSRPR